MSKALALLILGAAVLGLVPVGVRLSGEWGGLGPLATGFWRFALAVPVFWIWRLRSPASGDHEAPVRPWLLALAGLSFAGDIGFFFVSIAWTSMANATLLSNLAPVLVVACSVWVLRRPVALSGWIGALIAVGGTGLLVWPGEGVPALAKLGDLVGIVSAIFYAVYLLVIAEARRDQPVARVMLAVSVVGALVLGPAALLAGETLRPVGWQGWAVLCGLAWVTQVGGQGLITWSMAYVPAAFSSVVLLVQPLVAVVLGWCWFGEALGPPQVAGGALILIGIVVARRALSGAVRERKPKDQE